MDGQAGAEWSVRSPPLEPKPGPAETTRSTFPCAARPERHAVGRTGGWRTLPWRPRGPDRPGARGRWSGGRYRVGTGEESGSERPPREVDNAVKLAHIQHIPSRCVGATGSRPPGHESPVASSA